MVPGGDDRDHLPRFEHLVNNDVVSDDNSPQARIDTLQEPSSEMWVISECLDPIEQILHNAPRRRWIVFGDKVQEFRDSIQSRFRPDDAVTHEE